MDNESILLVDCSDSMFMYFNTGPHSAVRKVSDCRSRGCKLDPSLVQYFRGDSRRVVVSYKRKYVHKVLLTALSRLPREKNGYVN